jgi:hypothetical protein
LGLLIAFAISDFFAKSSSLLPNVPAGAVALRPNERER